MHFESYPFEKLNALLQNIEANKNYQPSILTIGEPQFETPDFIQKEFCNSSNLLNKYPKTAGEKNLKDAQLKFIYKRFNVQLNDEEIISTFGTREVLFNFPQFALFDKKNPVMAYTNPFYQIYEGSAKASRAKIIHINLTEENNFKPSIDEASLSKCALVIINFPNNPTASTISLEELEIWVNLALKYNFILINDECYSELYTNEPPPSLLEASLKVGNKEFKNILVVNSISKRSSAPGLRSGFIAGDKKILKEYLNYRTYVGCASPIPLQNAASIAWSDEDHVDSSRKLYKKNFEIAKEILGIKIPNATFYIWMKVPNAIEFTKKLYKNYNIKVLPGEFLARESNSFQNPAKNFIRIALVENSEKTKDALIRIKKCLDD